MTDPIILVTDPVCGMTIPAATAVVVEYRRTPYYFCESACAETFRQDPERWIEDEGEPLQALS